MQKDIDDAKRVCGILSIPYEIIDISGIYDSFSKALNPQKDITKINISPRIRMTLLYAAAQEKNYLVCGTGNRSERFVGYFTKFGDGAFDVNPIGEYTLTEVIALGRELGLPEDLIIKPPSDGISGKTDEENMGILYKDLDEYLLTGKLADAKKLEKILTLNRRNLHKTAGANIYKRQ